MANTDLNGKIVLITGASSGIGEACARRFAEAGARLILAARRRERLERLASELTVDTHPIAVDVRDRAEVEASLGALPQEWTAIDILINNAGLSRGLEKIHEGNPDSWDEMVDTNIKGLLYVSRTVIPGMVQRGSGHVINIGSIAGREVYPNGNVYCATKYAVDAITKGMRIDLVDSPVRVSTIDPGLVETEFSQVRFYGDKERAKKVYQGYQPLTGDDIADAAIWIASRPWHVQVAEVLVLPTAQRSTMIMKKE
ncbi:MAG: SDR family NAD(P)-dependent oxidoreductase [candidate division Zixibacteria bacterium]|nr:SDR family NAD(P)-dependent oxidoreductase [candidate division Zixibacteria bacterium]